MVVLVVPKCQLPCGPPIGGRRWSPYGLLEVCLTHEEQLAPSWLSLTPAREQSLVLLADHLVALARSRFQTRTVQHSNGGAAIADKAGSLQGAGCESDG
jgi:hypothetical protein